MTTTPVLTERDQADRRGDLPGRAVAALLQCVARQGVRKTTLDDVAQAAGCSRATLYRHFASKDALLAAAWHAEAQRVQAALTAAGHAAATLEDAVVAILLTAGAELGRHPALRFVAAQEPERLLPHLAFAGGDRVLATGAETLAPALARFVGPQRAPRAAEWVTRVGLALLFAPDPPVVLDDAAGVRAYTREFLLPAITAGAPVRPPAPTRR
jgi:AcrR family transcriptional regulator